MIFSRCVEDVEKMFQRRLDQDDLKTFWKRYLEVVLNKNMFNKTSKRRLEDALRKTKRKM